MSDAASNNDVVLRVNDIDVFYGAIPAVQDASESRALTGRKTSDFPVEDRIRKLSIFSETLVIK